MLQTVKRVTLNPKVFNIYSSPHFSVSCPAPIFHIKKSGPGIFQLASYLADRVTLLMDPWVATQFLL